MILTLAVKFRKPIAALMAGTMYAQLCVGEGFITPGSSAFRIPRLEFPNFANTGLFSGQASDFKPIIPNPKPETLNPEFKAPVPFNGGPTQPEMSSFKSVSANEMVDLFTGDFSYNIPLLDVGGYPVNIAYHSGITMEEEASWVGLGWNINPGSITRNMRGVPDDFNGGADTLKKVSHVTPNNSFGVSLGRDIEITGGPLDLGIGKTRGIFYNDYKGWGFEKGWNVSLSAGVKSFGSLSGALSYTNNSQEGITLGPSLSVSFHVHDYKNNSTSLSLSFSSPYNSRTGLKSLQMGLNASVYNRNTKRSVSGRLATGTIDFAWPTYSPRITMPMTNYNFSFTAKMGGEKYVFHESTSLQGYGGREFIANSDTSVLIPAYGYLNYQNMGNNLDAVTDFNREKEIPFREKPQVPHIGIPSYTYDVFAISGEGTGGSFRAYRGDIGSIADHLSRSKTISGAASIDFGAGNMVHGGTDLNANYSETVTGPWLAENVLRNSISFQKSNGLFEAVYFRNPAEKTINTTAFYDSIGGDDVVMPQLYQYDNNSPSILTTNKLLRVRGKQIVGSIPLSKTSAVRNTRDKRSQVISYLSAAEAAEVGLSRQIERYNLNQFQLGLCENEAIEDPLGKGTGLIGLYYKGTSFKGEPVVRHDPHIFFNWTTGNPFWQFSFSKPRPTTDFPVDKYSVRWVGRLKAPVSGKYKIGVYVDDGVRLWVNDTLVIDDWKVQAFKWDTISLNLVEGRLYNIKLEYFENGGRSFVQLGWKRPDQPTRPFDQDNKDTIPKEFLYPPKFVDTFAVNPILTREDRVNNFRKANHISQIDVLNTDGRRYVYGIPVYNLLQKEVSFAVSGTQGNEEAGLTGYNHGTTNTTRNANGKDGYFSKDEIPAYAHSFLLTGILSPDYVDITGDGISDDDAGDAIRFNYSKASGIADPFQWRAPYVKDSANYDKGLKTYNRDDKAHYIYGKKELWYLHSIESKTMVANFVLQPRKDLLEIDESGQKLNTGKAYCLKQIDLYSKADFMVMGTSATPIKTVHFEYSYELCRGVNRPLNDSGKLTLKKIWFTYNGNDKGQLNPYIFNYHGNNPGYLVNATDKWGTYKHPSQNPGYTSEKRINNGEYPYSLQDSAVAAYNAAAFMLDSIQLPSGGRIKVKYESDDYAYVQNRRAAQMLKLAGFGADTSGAYSNGLYDDNDHLYAYIKIPFPVSSKEELYARYLQGIEKFYFKLFVRMPADKWGSGSEYVHSFAEPDKSGNWYGITDANTIWIKMAGVSSEGDGQGGFSPLVLASINFLRINLPGKAYPGSEVGDDLDFVDGVKLITSMIQNRITALVGFRQKAKYERWARVIDTSRSLIRLNNPTLKKYGGGLRVKTILIYDHWNAMTGQRETVYGQHYDYTTTTHVNGQPTVISSGVASWEPAVGSEENPFHVPIEYIERVSALAPSALMYTEEPLGESFFPGASIGYSKVRMRTVHAKNTRSANGYTESSFYTSYDFPTTWDWSMLDPNTKKRFKPLLDNFLRINAQSFLTLSQGFKVELNDMNGKLRKEETFSETDPKNPISSTENFYRVDNQSAQFKHLSNIVSTVNPAGVIDTAATIGKNVELMADMRDQTSTSIGGNVNVNVDLFSAGALPVAIPSLINLYQKEKVQFRSAAMMKVIHRYGILDSVVHIEKGSLVSSKNLLYDSETGEPVLVRTQNEFNDPLFEFTYPAHWVYNGIGPAYKNIGAILRNITVLSGKITNGLSQPDSVYLTAGDELLVYSRQGIEVAACDFDTASFPDAYKLWVIDSNLVKGGPQQLFLVDRLGIPFNGYDITIKVIRSGRRNMNGAVGSVSSLSNPVRLISPGNYQLVFDTATHVLNASANEFKQVWQVADKRRTEIFTNCVPTAADSAQAGAELCSCLKPFFDYLIDYNKLYNNGFPIPFKKVGTLVNEAIAAGYPINLENCDILANNANERFRVINSNRFHPVYIAAIGNVIVQLRSRSGMPVQFANLNSSTCESEGVIFRDTSLAIPKPDTITVRFIPDFTANLISGNGECPIFQDSLLTVDSISDKMLVENRLEINGALRNAISVLRFDSIRYIPESSTILSAQLVLQADTRGHYPPQWANANSTNPVDSVSLALTAPSGWFPYLPLDTIVSRGYYSAWHKQRSKITAFQSDTFDMADYLTDYLKGIYTSASFMLTQGSHDLQGVWANDTTRPGYLSSGYTNYYSTYYSPRYADTTKWPALMVTYIVPPPPVDTSGAILEYNSSIACTSIFGKICYSPVTDTFVNPYQYSILGNFRPNRSYVYYGRRKESDPLQATNIRKDGTILDFAPFWVLSSGRWFPSYDTTRWVWNSEATVFNRKGFELENKDPLGRFNSGIYGYGLTLPTAIIQNSRFRESAYEGFEDYGFTPNSCDTSCPLVRPFDFSAYQSKFSTAEAHTGLYSLGIEKDSAISLTVNIEAANDSSLPQLNNNASTDACNPTPVLKGFTASGNAILPSFSPMAGKRMVISAWVKEDSICNCQSYTRNHILVTFENGGTPVSLTLSPAGNIVEGWQRFENVIDVPGNAQQMIVTLQASDSSFTWFDDIRIHPYNAQMKSYVFNPVNLRLMAELDERNYATLYEYDDDGTLVRLKKETERGIQTIKETRSALVKLEQ